VKRVALVVGCWLLVVGGKIKGWASRLRHSSFCYSFCCQKPTTNNQQPTTDNQHPLWPA